MLFPGGCCFLVNRCWLMVDAVSSWVLFPGGCIFKTPDQDACAGESLFSNICWLMVDAVSWRVLFPSGWTFLNA